jgi:hypothetical protein
MMLNVQTLLQCDREAAVRILEQAPWLLIPDLDLRLYRSGMQQIFCRSSLPTTLDADFLVVERQYQSLHLQLVSLAGPQDDILREGTLSAELQSALSKVTRWSVMAHECLTQWLRDRDDAGNIRLISYRVVIGDSQRQSDQERAVVRSLRTNVLRIRSFQWLLEKQRLYPELKTVN